MSEAATLGAKIAKACLLDGELTPDDMIKGLGNGTYQQFARNGTVVLTKLMTSPMGKGCRIVMAAGDFEDVWAVHDEEIVPWAKEKGREFMIGDGRKGWKASAEARGYVEQGYRINAAGNEVITMIRNL